jgi:hypothetical protein
MKKDKFPSTHEKKKLRKIKVSTSGTTEKQEEKHSRRTIQIRAGRTVSFYLHHLITQAGYSAYRGSSLAHTSSLQRKGEQSVQQAFSPFQKTA